MTGITPAPDDLLRQKTSKISTQEKILSQVKAPPLPSYVTGEREKTEPKKSANQMSIEEMMTQVNKIHDEIEQKLEEVYKKTGWTPEYLNNHLANSNNFTNEEWTRIQNEQKSLKDKFQIDDRKVNKKAKKKTEGFLGEIDKNSPTLKEHRSKTAGIRRNWIPMK